MSLASGYGLDRWGKPLAYVIAILEAALFCAVSALFFLGAAVLCAAIAHGGKPLASGVSTNPWVWVGAAQPWAHVLAILAYPLLAAVYWLPGRASPEQAQPPGPGPLHSFAQAALFLLVSAAYFLLVALVCAAIAHGADTDPFSRPLAWFAALPARMWLATFGVYGLIVLLYWSRARVAGIEVPRRVSPAMVAKVVLFCALTAAFFILAALAHAAVAQGLGKLKLRSFWQVESWFADLPAWMYLLMGAGYLLLLVLHRVYRARTGVGELARTLLPPLIPFVKTAWFWAFSAAYLMGTGVLYAAVAAAAGKGYPGPALNVGALLAAVPVWVYALILAGYLLLITIYWAPGSERASALELRGFTALLILALAVGCCAVFVRPLLAMAAACWAVFVRLVVLPFWRRPAAGP